MNKNSDRFDLLTENPMEYDLWRNAWQFVMPDDNPSLSKAKKNAEV